MIKHPTDGLDAGLAIEDQLEARAAAERIRTRMRRTAEDIVEIGRDSEHFNAQVRGFLRMLDMTRQSVAAAGEKILELEADEVSPL